jgi:hypothetical protein
MFDGKAFFADSIRADQPSRTGIRAAQPRGELIGSVSLPRPDGGE